MKNDEIEITGCDLRLLVKKAYELSRPQGMGFLHAKPGPLSDGLVDDILMRDRGPHPIMMDYVQGRAVKLSVRRDENNRLWIRSRWYDHSESDLQQLLEAIGVKAPTS